MYSMEGEKGWGEMTGSLMEVSMCNQSVSAINHSGQISVILRQQELERDATNNNIFTSGKKVVLSEGLQIVVFETRVMFAS